MKTIISKLTVILFLGIITSSCGVDLLNHIEGNKNVISEQRKLNKSFSSIKASNGLDVYLKQGSTTSVTVEADENLHDFIITEVEGNTLKIYTERNIWRAKSRKVYVSFSNIEEITATSGSEVYSQNTIKSSNLNVSSSSGADMRLDLEADIINSNCSSGADIKLSGIANIHGANASSGSTIKAYELLSKEAIVRVSSGADITVFAKEKIDAKASSGGDIRYKGNPKKVFQKSNSGGGISSRS